MSEALPAERAVAGSAPFRGAPGRDSEEGGSLQIAMAGPDQAATSRAVLGQDAELEHPAIVAAGPPGILAPHAAGSEGVSGRGPGLLEKPRAHHPVGARRGPRLHARTG